MPSGGKREGAGAKPLPAEQRRRRISVKLAPETLDYLASVPNKTAAIEAAIKASRGWARWRRSAGNPPSGQP